MDWNAVNLQKRFAVNDIFMIFLCCFEAIVAFWRQQFVFTYWWMFMLSSYRRPVYMRRSSQCGERSGDVPGLLHQRVEGWVWLWRRVSSWQQLPLCHSVSVHSVSVRYIYCIIHVLMLDLRYLHAHFGSTSMSPSSPYYKRCYCLRFLFSRSVNGSIPWKALY